MKNKKVILSSILSLLLCLSLIAGGTFALFTSTANTNIAITSGNVEVLAWIDNIETATLGDVRTDKTFALGGSASYNAAANKLTVDKIAPGDSVKFDVNIENKSNINVSYRVKVAFVGELQNALVANIKLPGDDSTTALTAANVSTKWKQFDETNKVVLPMNVELPVGVGSDYMNESAEIIVTVEAVQGNATNLIMVNNTTYSELSDAVNAANDGDTISLSGGAFKLPADGSLQNRILTFESIDDNVATVDVSEKGRFAQGATLTFDGVTVLGYDKEDTFYTEQFNDAAVVNYNNCTVIGLISTYCNSNFKKCVFTNTFADQYSIFDYGAAVVNVEDCTFNTPCSKAIKLYNEGAQGATLNLKNCTFNTYTLDKAAIEIDSTYTTEGYIVDICNCTITGAYEKLVNDKGTNSKVHVDGYVASANELYAAIATAKEGDIILVKGNFGAVTLPQGTKDITIKAADNKTTMDSLNLYDAQNVTIEGITFDATKAAAVYLNGSTTSENLSGYTASIYDSRHLSTPLKNITIKDCTFTGVVTNVVDNGTAGYTAININDSGAGDRSDGVTVESCKFNCNASSYIYIQYLKESSTVTVKNNTFGSESCNVGWAAVAVQQLNGGKVVITGNTFNAWDNNDSAIKVSTKSGAAATVAEITGNTFNGGVGDRSCVIEIRRSNDAIHTVSGNTYNIVGKSFTDTNTLTTASGDLTDTAAVWYRG